jgi:hypothetical protein
VIAILIMRTGPGRAQAPTHGAERFWPCVSERERRRPTEPPAAAPRHDVGDHHAADHAAELKLVERLTGPQTGHELDGALVLGPRHALAGVDEDALTDSGLELARRGAVLDVLAAVDHRPSEGLTNGYGSP